MSALNEKIIKILEARAIQKRNIESDKLEREIYDDNLERKSKPVVQAIKTSQTNKPAIQMQGNNLPVTRLREQQMRHPSLTQASAAESTATSATPGEEPWIQKLYRKYRNSTKCKTTQFEIAEKGVLGLYGQVDVALLFNENILNIRIPGKADIYENKLSAGLVALLLLPLDDLKRSKITPTNQDMSQYVDIMSRTGFSSINSKKYQTYITVSYTHLTLPTTPYV